MVLGLSVSALEQQQQPPKIVFRSEPKSTHTFQTIQQEQPTEIVDVERIGNFSVNAEVQVSHVL